MMRSISNETPEHPLPEAHDAFLYVFSKAAAIFEIYILADISIFILHQVTKEHFTWRACLQELFHFKWELLMINLAGFIPDPQFNVDYLLPPGWYISAMLIALLPSYYLAKKFRKEYSGVIAPVAMMCGYCLIIQKTGTMNAGGELVGLLFVGLIRAFAGIGASEFAYNLYDHLEAKGLFEKEKRLLGLLDVLAWGMLLVLFILSVDAIPYADTVFWLFPFAVLIICGDRSIGSISPFLNNHLGGLFQYLGKLSLFVYLFHFQILVLFQKWFPMQNQAVAITVFLGVVTVTSALLMAVYDEWKKYRVKIQASKKAS